MLRKPRETTTIEADLKALVDQMTRDAKRRPLNDSELRDAERLVRLLDLSARVAQPIKWWRSIKWGRLFWLIAIPLTGVGLATYRQSTTTVRITVEATAAQLAMGADEQIVLGTFGDTITLNGFKVSRAPAELSTILQSQAEGAISLKGSALKNLTLDRITLMRGTELGISADINSVSFHLGCVDACGGIGVRLVARGELRSGASLDTVEAPSSMEFTPRENRPSITLSRRDSATIPLAALVPVLSAAFQQIFLDGGGHSAAPVSAIDSGMVTLPDYPTKSRSLARGDEFYVVGSGLLVSAIDRRGDRLVFSLEGTASELSLNGEDLRPSLWDSIHTHPFWSILMGFLGGGLAMLILFLSVIRGRPT
jgi:hypothetical protein